MWQEEGLHRGTRVGFHRGVRGASHGGNRRSSQEGGDGTIPSQGAISGEGVLHRWVKCGKS